MNDEKNIDVFAAMFVKLMREYGALECFLIEYSRRDIRNCLDEDDHTRVCNIIDVSFVWSCTNDGRSYWHHLDYSWRNYCDCSKYRVKISTFIDHVNLFLLEEQLFKTDSIKT